MTVINDHKPVALFDGNTGTRIPFGVSTLVMGYSWVYRHYWHSPSLHDKWVSTRWEKGTSSPKKLFGISFS